MNKFNSIASHLERVSRLQVERRYLNSETEGTFFIFTELFLCGVAYFGHQKSTFQDFYPFFFENSPSTPWKVTICFQFCSVLSLSDLFAFNSAFRQTMFTLGAAWKFQLYLVYNSASYLSSLPVWPNLSSYKRKTPKFSHDSHEPPCLNEFVIICF